MSNQTTVYQTTTEHRTHWIDAAGRRYEQRHPFRTGLTPVLNLSEVQGWIDLHQGSEDGRVFYARQFLAGTCHPSERDRLAPLIAEELTDDVPRYHDGIRGLYVVNRESRPLPQLTGYPVELRNLTPHTVSVGGEVAIEPSGMIARACEESTPAEPLRVLRQDDHPGVVMASVPTTTTRYTGLIDVPDPQPGVYLIVSLITARVAARIGRWTGDLLTPGQQVRDSAGRVIGCRSLDRVAAA